MPDQSQKGFTLIEAIVAASLFAIVITSIVSVYVDTIKLNRKTDAIRQASENARYLSEYLSKEIRNGQVDYYGPTISPCSTNISASSQSLALLSVDKVHMCFYLGDAAGQLTSDGSGPNLWMFRGNLGPYKINSDNVKVTGLTFYVNPASNPYAAGSRVEPSVTLTGSVQSAIDGTIFPIQTSISIPAYDISAP